MLKALLGRIAHLNTLGAQLRATLNLRQQVGPYAAQRVADLERQSEPFRRSPRTHKAQVQADIEQERRGALDAAAGHLTFELERSWPALDAEIRAARQQLQSAPGPLAAYLRRTGGLRINLSDQVELMIELLDETRRARFARELADAPPSLVRDLYAAASQSETDESASLTRYVEAFYTDGWSGHTPTDEGEVSAAVALRRLIQDTRAARVPPELDEAARAVEAISVLVARATNEQTHKVTPINLAQRPDLVQQWEAAREEIETASAEHVEHAEPEAAAS